MEISTLLSQTDLLKLKGLVETANKSLAGGKGIQSTLGKDDFLKVLMTQLTHQDPTQPLEDREFISQMASFSTLEQMTNLNDDISQIFAMLRRSEALGLLGKNVEIALASGQTLVGAVEEVTGDESPQLLVNGTYYDPQDVVRIRK